MKTYVHNVVQVVVFRRNPSVEFLVMKRSSADGGWWQSVTGHIEAGESALDALRREVKEETGVTDLKLVSDQIYTYEYEMADGSGRDVVYMVEVDRAAEITLSDEHEAFAWMSLNDALGRLKYEGNKESLRRAYNLIPEE